MKRLFFLVMIGLASWPAAAEPPVILVFGDSISAGYGLARAEDGWVELLRAKLKSGGYGYQVVNASVSGETTAGGLARLPRALTLHHPEILVLELGGNDGLRVLPIAQMRSNLTRMVTLARSSGARTLLLGMRIPANYGAEYTEQFHSAFAEVATHENAPIVPFLLEGVALTQDLVQADGIHPNERAQPSMLANVWQELAPMLKK